MEREAGNKLNELLGKRLKIIFDDGGNWPSHKEGILDDYTDDFFMLSTSTGQQAVARHKIIRWEVLS